jgi:hypothetical protein
MNRNTSDKTAGQWRCLTMRTLLRSLLVFTVILSWATAPLRSADPGPKLPVEVRLQTGDGMPTVEVMVNGQGPFVFGFDTGAQAGPRIDASLVDKLKLKSDLQRTW